MIDSATAESIFLIEIATVKNQPSWKGGLQASQAQLILIQPDVFPQFLL